MSWTTPLTAVANAAFTAAQFNASVRDNLLETAPAKATTTGRIFVATGTNAIAERAITSANVSTSETTTSATYANLTTTGPVVTVTTGTNAIAFVSSQVSNNTNGAFTGVGVTVSGASSIAAADADGILFQPSTAASAGIRTTVAVHYTGTLTAGSNTFTMQYRASAGTGTFQLRKLTVIAL